MEQKRCTAVLAVMLIKEIIIVGLLSVAHFGNLFQY